MTCAVAYKELGKGFNFITLYENLRQFGYFSRLGYFAFSQFEGVQSAQSDSGVPILQPQISEVGSDLP